MNAPEIPSAGVSGAERFLLAVLRWGAVAAFVLLLVLVAVTIFSRFVPLFSLGWADEIIELSFAWMVFLATAVLWRGNEHITIDFVPQALAGSRAGRVLEIVVGLLALAFLLVFTWEGWKLTLQAAGNRTPILELPRLGWYVALPISGVVMIGYTLRRCLRALRPGNSAAATRSA